MGNNFCEECWYKEGGSHALEPITIITVHAPPPLPILSKPIQNHLDSHKPFQKLHQLQHNSNPIKLPETQNIYEGQLNQKRQPHGFGRIYFQNDSVFEGDFVNGVVEGKGHYIYHGGCIYGSLKNWQPQNGVYISKDGLNRYDGQFSGRFFHGKGKQRGIGYTFEGIYDNGARIKGVMKYNTIGTSLKQNKNMIAAYPWKQPKERDYDFVYEGSFDKEARFTGIGTLEGPNGKYEGKFENGKKNGKGAFTFKQGYRYEGEYINNKKQGRGTLYSPEFKILYSGQWKDNLPHGKGIAQNSQGKKVQVLMQRGIDQHKLQFSGQFLPSECMELFSE